MVKGQVLVLEPRRIAARLAARRTSAEMGEPLGETVGFQVRFEEVGGPRTRLRFITEGVLTRRILSDPELKGVDAVVLDEFHERHLETDLALALLRRLQIRRPELILIVMSATLDTAPVAEFLGGCRVLTSHGRAFKVELLYESDSAASLERQVSQAIRKLLTHGHTGHMLVFLPGAAEIRKASRECQAVAAAAGALVLPLYGDLSAEEQDRAIAPNAHQKIILATNIAESSVTIEGVTAVIDSGLARIASHSAWSGLSMLQVARISKASANQRAGRAGRTGPGIAIRLYPQADFAQRPEYDTPEILRDDLSGLCLQLMAMGLRMSELQWLDAPAPAALQQAEDLLARLGANSEEARHLARLPLPPRLARVFLEAGKRHVAEEAITAVALLASGVRPETPDLLVALDRPPDPVTKRVESQLRRFVRPTRQKTGSEQALLLCLLSGYSDRVAQRRGDRHVLLANGVTAELRSEVPPFEYMVVLDAEIRAENPMPSARLVAEVKPEWLLDLFPEQIREESGLVWNSTTEQVETVSVLRYEALTLTESRSGIVPAEGAAEMLAAQALQAGLDHFLEVADLEQLFARIRFAGCPEPDLQAAVRSVCRGLRSFAELREAAGQILAAVESQAGADLNRRAPVSLRLTGGRATKVHYEEGRSPWIASRLQDFFGMSETPKVGNQVPVVVHLLAPNRRAVQTTTDLRGFWERLYPQVRRELMRRYPRHFWPEDPTKPVPAQAPKQRK